MPSLEEPPAMIELFARKLDSWMSEGKAVDAEKNENEGTEGGFSWRAKLCYVWGRVFLDRAFMGKY